MISWDKTGLWQLSVLSPMKEGPLFPGFEDTSYEELRVSAYQAKSDPAAFQQYVSTATPCHSATTLSAFR